MKSDTTFAASGYASADIQLFRDVSDIDKLIGDFSVCRFTAGETLPAVVGGDALLYVVLQGALKVSVKTAADGSAEISGEVLPGQCVGELSVLGGERRGVSISATQTTDVLVIDAAGLWKLIDELSGFARKLLMLRSFAAPANDALSGQQNTLAKPSKKGAEIDVAAGLQTRAWLDKQLPGMAKAAHKANLPFSMLMIRLDYATRFTESDSLSAKSAKEEAFKAASDAIFNAIRPSDFAARFGESEIAVLLPNANVQGAAMVAQRLSARIDKTVITDMREPLPHLSASFGAACLAPKQKGSDLIAASVAALERAENAETHGSIPSKERT